MIAWLDSCFSAEKADVDREVLAADVLERHGDWVLFILDQAMEGFLGSRGSVGGIGAVDGEGEGGIAFVYVGLFARQRVLSTERGFQMESYACVGM